MKLKDGVRGGHQLLLGGRREGLEVSHAGELRKQPGKEAWDRAQGHEVLSSDTG